MQVKRWNIAPMDQKLHAEIQEHAVLSPLVGKVLASRYPGETWKNLNDKLFQQMEFESPFQLKDMDRAVERIQEAIYEGEKIAIYGDYDCDGITSTAMLFSFFQSIGADVFYYIPSRETEGYGMNKKAMDVLLGYGTDLIITVDNGISSHEEIAYASSLGIDTIVTDHHTPREKLPPAVAVVNPHRKDCPSRFKEYAGVGVAFQLICAVEESDPWEMLNYYGDLVAIGTIADLVPLIQENRGMVTYGLELLNQMCRPGIQALLEVGKIGLPLSSESVSFGIAPRINAAGRMDSVDKAVELLLTEDPHYAKEIAEHLQQMNKERRNIEDDVLKTIQGQLAENPEKLLQRVLIVSGEGWHQGVMGIVASRLVNRYGKPCIVFSVADGVAKGSGRSLEGFSLIEAITQCSQYLTHYGGHTLAAGMTLSQEHLSDFEHQIESYAQEHYEMMPVPSYRIDALLEMQDLTIENIETLSTLAPFGAGNPSPVFLLDQLTLTGIYPTADQKHIRLRFQKEEREFQAIYFRMTPGRFPYTEGTLLDAVAAVDVSEWNGNPQLSIKIQDLRPSNYPQENGIAAAERYRCYRRQELGVRCKKEDLCPSREELAVLYRYLRQQKHYSYGPVALWEQLIEKEADLARVQVGLDIFEEAGLIQREQNLITVVPQTTKVDLEETSTLQYLQN